VSHPSLPFGSVVLLTNPTSGQSTFARVIDRGPVEDALLVDVSEAVAARLGLAAQSDQLVALRIVE
jgi:rare lipoprotein A